MSAFAWKDFCILNRNDNMLFMVLNLLTIKCCVCLVFSCGHGLFLLDA